MLKLRHDGRSSVWAGDHGAARVEPALPGAALDGAQDRIGPNHPKPGRSGHLADVLLVVLEVIRTDRQAEATELGVDRPDVLGVAAVVEVFGQLAGCRFSGA